MSISYTAVVLDLESQERIKQHFLHSFSITHAHHCTICMGPLVHPKGKHDLHLDWKKGEACYLYVVAVRYNPDQSVIALRVLTDGRRTRTAFPHITLYVGDGHKPKESNQLTDMFERRLSQPFLVTGIVTEIPNKRSK